MSVPCARTRSWLCKWNINKWAWTKLYTIPVMGQRESVSEDRNPVASQQSCGAASSDTKEMGTIGIIQGCTFFEGLTKRSLFEMAKMVV